jgi:hypothetical protein
MAPGSSGIFAVTKWIVPRFVRTGSATLPKSRMIRLLNRKCMRETVARQFSFLSRMFLPSCFTIRTVRMEGRLWSPNRRLHMQLSTIPLSIDQEPRIPTALGKRHGDHFICSSDRFADVTLAGKENRIMDAAKDSASRGYARDFTLTFSNIVSLSLKNGRSTLLFKK